MDRQDQEQIGTFLSAVVSTVSGSFKGGDATVYLAGFSGWAGIQRGMASHKNVTLDNMRYAYSASMDLQALTAIHELIHFNFHDVPLANAVAALNKGTDTTFTYRQTKEASEDWGKELKKHCERKK